MAHERQQWLWDSNGELSTVENEQRPTSQRSLDLSLDSVADDELRPRLIAVLQRSEQPVEMRELRRELGHPSPYLDQDPQANPVNRLVKEMRDAGQLVVQEFERGEPFVSLPHAEKNAATGVPKPGSWERDVEQRFEANFVQPVMRELAERPWSTAEALGNQALGRKRIANRMATASDILRQQVAAGTAQVAWSKDGMPFYSMAGVPVPGHLATQEQIDAAGGGFPGASAELVRPDRQQTFDGLSPYDWPKPVEDGESISVDRIRDDIDGPAHRFVIRRGDAVEVFLGPDRQQVGEVVDLAFARHQARVRFEPDGDATWFDAEKLFPSREPVPTARSPSPRQLPDPVATQPAEQCGEADGVEPARDSPSGGVESLAVQHRPFALADFRELLAKLDDASLAFDQWREAYDRLRATQRESIAAMQKGRSADRLKLLAFQFGSLDAKRNTKRQNAERIIEAMLAWFTLSSGVQYNPLNESWADAVDRIVQGITAEDFAAYLAERQQERQDREQALSDPQTIDQFRLFLREHDYHDLTTDQQSRFDQLLADQSRQRRRDQRSRRIVSQVEADDTDDLAITIIEGEHTKQQIPLWICQLSKRVSGDTFRQLKIKAKQLGGWWSSFVRGQEGFQFKTPEAAEQFRALLAGNVDRSDILEGRRARKMESASDRLASVADTLAAEAEAILDSDADRLQNTVRRAEMAAGMRGRAYANRAMAQTLHSIASSLAVGEAQYLDGVRAATHIETLVHLLHRGKRDRNTKLMEPHANNGVWERHHHSETLSNRPPSVEDVAFAPYPFPEIYKRHIEELLVRAKERRGMKRVCSRMRSFVVGEGYYAEFVDESDIALLEDFLQRCKAAGEETRWAEGGMDDYKRLRAADVHTPQELRCALRELLPHLRRKAEDDPVRKLEQQLIGQNIPGFFPTPRSVITRMLELAQIEPGHRVLEPSAGKGDILDLILEQHPQNDVTAIEINRTLHEVLAAKGHDVDHSDFLEHRGQYDRIVMNPPFENGQDIDHVRHAATLLNGGGRLVAVMSEGPFFRQDAKAQEFRQWLEELGGVTEPLPEDAFKTAEAFRQTGVRTRLVCISRTCDA